MAVAVPIGNDVFGHRSVNAGYVLQQGWRGGVQFDAHMVDGRFDDSAEGVNQFLLVDIVLVLADADGFRVDFHELCQGILYAAGNGYSAA